MLTSILNTFSYACFHRLLLKKYGYLQNNVLPSGAFSYTLNIENLAVIVKVLSTVNRRSSPLDYLPSSFVYRTMGCWASHGSAGISCDFYPKVHFYCTFNKNPSLGPLLFE